MSGTKDLVAADTLPDSAGSERGEVSRSTLEAQGDARYREEGMLGRGGMGVVTAYYDRRIGRRVAFKELRRDIVDDEQTRARFLREARVQGQLEHPAIVPVYDVGVRDDGAPYFTMKTVRGVTLAELLARLAAGETDKMLAPHRLLSAFSRICMAVEYAHEHGVLHRDLKPANLILGDYGEVYVLDWGLAKLIGESELARDPAPSASQPDATNASTLLGTPGYMAPEQIDDPSRVSPAADVYALGAILFEILALEPLHERGLGALDSARRGVEARPSVRAPGRDAPPELETAIVRATSLDPATRGSPRELSDVIERYLEGERDLVLRRERAAEHARAAARAVADASGSDPHALDARRLAMREINRALVLDPANHDAMATMVELLSRAPDAPPPELVDQAESQFRREMRWISGVGAAIYFSMIGFTAFMWWMGIRQPWVIVAFFAFMAISGVLSVIVTRSREPDLRLVAIAIVTSAAAFGVATRFASPLVLVPAAVAVNATGYAVFLQRKYRAFVMLASCASILVPLALELAGIVSPTFAFEHGRLEILPMALDLPANATIAVIAVASCTSVFLGSVIIGYMRDRLADAESRVFMYAWHLRELVPPEVRSRTDPMRITRRSGDRSQ